MRFCSRCGFPLSVVKELLVSGGVLATPEVTRKPELATRLKGARQGAWIMLVSLFLILFCVVLTAIDEDLAVLLIFPILCFLFGFVRLLYGVFVQGRPPREKKDVPQLPPIMVQPALSPARGIPIENFTVPIRTTAEVIQPPSVTENTTKLLDDHAEQNRELS